MTRLSDLFDLSGKVAIVTGGGSALGFQIAEALGEFGARIALVARKEAALDAAVTALAGQGITAFAFAADLSDETVHATLVDRILEQFGRIDILVNNAGTTWGAPAEDYPIEGWNKVIDLSLTAVFLLSQMVARRAFLPQGQGAIINVASIAGFLGHHPSRVGTVAYNVAKGGVITMTRALAAEWGPRNIRVNALAPGFFPSKMTAKTLDEHGADVIAQTPLGKLGGDADLKGATLLLASNAGAHITGQVIVVDGGASII